MMEIYIKGLVHNPSETWPFLRIVPGVSAWPVSDAGRISEEGPNACVKLDSRALLCI